MNDITQRYLTDDQGGIYEIGMNTILRPNFTAKYELTSEEKDTILKELICWFRDHELFDPDSIIDNDTVYTEGQYLLANINKIINFKVEWHE